MADLGGARAFQPRQVARRLDHRHMQAVTDAEERHILLAREFDRLDLAFGAALAKTARHQDAAAHSPGTTAASSRSNTSLSIQSRWTFTLLANPPWVKRFGQRFVAVLDLHVFADHGDAHFAFGILHPLHHRLPAREIGRRRILDAEDLQKLRCPAPHRDRRAARDRSCPGPWPGSPARRADCRTGRSCGGPRREWDGTRGKEEYRAGCRWRAVP